MPAKPLFTLTTRLLLIPLLFMPVVATGDSKHQLKEQELKQLQGKIAQLRKGIDRDRSRYSVLSRKLRRVDNAVARLAKGITTIIADLGGTKKRLKELTSRKTRLQKGVDLSRSYLSAQLRSYYMMGEQHHLKILLKQQDPAVIGRLRSYFRFFNQARSEQIGILTTTLEQLAEVERSLAKEATELQRLKGKRQQEQQALRKEQLARNKLVDELKKEIKQKGVNLKHFVRQEEELRALIQTLIEALDDIPEDTAERAKFARLKGSLAWPVKGRWLHRYGEDRGAGQKWRGMLIGASRGTDVRVISYGRVAYADWLRGYGLLIIIDHGEGYMSLYGHNESLYKEVGDWVEAGEQIATVGNSGGKKRSALYFEVRANGEPTNPRRWCRKRG